MHIFHHRFIGIGLLMAALAAPHMAQATGFLSMLRDVPLAEGLVELPEAGIVFDKPQGRIVQMTATHHQGVTQKALMAFYSRLSNFLLLYSFLQNHLARLRALHLV